MKHILLVEDDPFIAEIYTIQLKKEGYMVSIAKDGQMALDKIKQAGPDLLILDINLPKIDGWEVLRILRKDPKTNDLKTIILSNDVPQGYTDEIAMLKIIKYFLKVETTAKEIGDFIKEILK